MKCSKCPHYDFKINRCKKGLLNPKTIKGGVDAALVMSIHYICGIDEENRVKKEKINKKFRELR